jgi:membrane protein implicated in regulation of membrane protease activity
MSDAPIMAVAGVGAALMAASGALSAERLAIAGVAVIFVAAVWKFAKARKSRVDRRSGDDRRHDTNAEPPVAIGSR